MPFPEVDGAFPRDAFADVLEGNSAFAQTFAAQGLTGRAAKHLAVITCMDSRINPLALLGMQAGDVKILRNAGARVTSDVMRTLVMACYLLDVKRILVMPHTGCTMASATEAELHERISDEFGIDTRSMEFRVVKDQRESLTTDLTRIRTFPLLPADLIVAGAIYDVKSGRLHPVDA
ncbi:MAG: carbonic anhydrase [Actinomycetes bacterium]